jgi:hypothetical protein
MHRSGTSALTRVLNLAGAELGATLLEPMEGVNDRGFWEHAEVKALHEELLEKLGSSWHDTDLLPYRWWWTDDARSMRLRLRDVLLRDFAHTPLWAVKDPRLCRLLPMWLDLFAELDWKPVFVLAVRDPHEIAASLARRDLFPQTKSLLLWIDHVLQAEYWTRAYPRAIVTYDSLLADWRGVMARIAERLDVIWPACLEAIAGRVESFLSPELRHQRGGNVLGAPERALDKWAQRAWKALADPAVDAAALAGELDCLRQEVHAARTLARDRFQSIVRGAPCHACWS